MSAGGRGRGYSGRHHLRDETLRPGDVPLSSEPPRPEPARSADDVTRLTESMRPIEHKEALKRTTSGGSVHDIKELETKPYGQPHADDEQVLKELLYIEDQYRPILTQLEQFCPGEDGIIFNRKLRDLESTLTAICQDDTQLQQAFGTLHAAALTNPATARKLATAGASFTRQQRQNVLRKTLLNMMQNTYSKLDVLERASPQCLVNAANLMGDYFAEARLANGSKVLVLCPPLLKYLRSLLASSDKRAHRSLATQLLQNGRDLLTTNAPELEELSISIRIRLLSPPPASIIWLLLSADLCINKFLNLPESLQTFYASHFDLTQDETQPNYSEVTYGSWKKDNEDWKASDLPESSPDISDRLDQSLSQMNVSSEENGARKPRPILGAGAALNRQNNSFVDNTAAPNQDSYDSWGKSTLAKRYDLNSWRQSENEENDGDLDSHSSDKFIPSQQFVPNENTPFDGKTYPNQSFARSLQFQSAQNDAKFAQYTQKLFTHGDGKYAAAQFASQDRYVTQSAPIPQGDGKYNQPPPPLSDGKFHQPPPPQVEGKYTQPPPSQVDGKFHQPPPSQIEGKYNQPPPSQSDGKFHQPPPGDAKFTPPQPVDRTERTPSFTEKNFPNSERPRRPPENWRKEKSDVEDANRNRPQQRKVDWVRQKSKDSFSDEQSVIESPENERVGFRDGSGDAKPFRTTRQVRESRPNQRQVRPTKAEEDPAKPPVRRHVTEVPRSQKYWDHDDRLDKDYNS